MDNGSERGNLGAPGARGWTTSWGEGWACGRRVGHVPQPLQRRCCRSVGRGLGLQAGMGLAPARSRGIGPRAASSPPLLQEGRWLGPPKASGGGNWKEQTSRAQSAPRPLHLRGRLPTFAASTFPAAPPAAAAATPPETMPWRRLSALLRNRWTRGSPPGMGSGRRLEHSEFVEYTEAPEGQSGPVEPVNASEATFALIVFFSSHLIPCGWFLSRMGSYRRVQI
ncbi:uncharacterized protein LOC110217761 [Phascolarctos cinereus]|uniref:Uncharacterized protein LOC110217761 n=1 Tax=Phascolarctos cinereus TaxID=38626 RepID=A0A6P5LJP8_PHACI|nr:uncharacterized protein LOC110217761 [Phascolarctos cinereus]